MVAWDAAADRRGKAAVSYLGHTFAAAAVSAPDAGYRRFAFSRVIVYS